MDDGNSNHSAVMITCKTEELVRGVSRSCYNKYRNLIYLAGHKKKPIQRLNSKLLNNILPNKDSRDVCDKCKALSLYVGTTSHKLSVLGGIDNPFINNEN